MEKAYDYYKNKKVPMPYDLYILLTDKMIMIIINLKPSKEFFI